VGVGHQIVEYIRVGSRRSGDSRLLRATGACYYARVAGGTLTVVHAADIHLDTPLIGLARYEGAPVERIREATRRAFVALVELCLSEQAKLLLLAGDLYDGSWKDYSTGLFFAAEMSRLRDAGVQVVWIRGNHDATSQITKRLKLPDNVRELSCKQPSTEIFDDLGLAVHGQGFATREVSANLALAYPDPLPGLVNFGLLHTSVTGREGHEPYAPCRLEDLVHKGYDYWALGHVHTREILSRDPWVVFPGNLQGRHARETGAKGAMLIEIDSGRLSSVEPVVLDGVRWTVCRVDAAGCSGPDDVLEEVRRALERELEAAEGRLLAARIVIEGTSRAHVALGDDPERWLHDLRAVATDTAYGDVWVEKVLLRTTPPFDLNELRRRDDPLGHVVRALDRLRHDETALAELVPEIGELRSRLKELGTAADGSALDAPERLLAAVDDVERLLLPRLLGEGREP
jgi:DNA repair protein SbcD/Mre11